MANLNTDVMQLTMLSMAYQMHKCFESKTDGREVITRIFLDTLARNNIIVQNLDDKQKFRLCSIYHSTMEDQSKRRQVNLSRCIDVIVQLLFFDNEELEGYPGVTFCSPKNENASWLFGPWGPIGTFSPHLRDRKIIIVSGKGELSFHLETKELKIDNDLLLKLEPELFFVILKKTAPSLLSITKDGNSITYGSKHLKFIEENCDVLFKKSGNDNSNPFGLEAFTEKDWVVKFAEGLEVKVSAVALMAVRCFQNLFKSGLEELTTKSIDLRGKGNADRNYIGFIYWLERMTENEAIIPELSLTKAEDFQYSAMMELFTEVIPDPDFVEYKNRRLTFPDGLVYRSEFKG